jgi:osmoprotectant transport system permease protein
MRSATLQVVSTATLAAYTADAGLGRFVFTGLKSQQYGELLGGSLLVVVLALALDGVFGLILRMINSRPSTVPLPVPSTERIT